MDGRDGRDVLSVAMVCSSTVGRQVLLVLVVFDEELAHCEGEDLSFCVRACAGASVSQSVHVQPAEVKEPTRTITRMSLRRVDEE